MQRSNFIRGSLAREPSHCYRRTFRTPLLARKPRYWAAKGPPPPRPSPLYERWRWFRRTLSTLDAARPRPVVWRVCTSDDLCLPDHPKERLHSRRRRRRWDLKLENRSEDDFVSSPKLFTAASQPITGVSLPPLLALALGTAQGAVDATQAGLALLHTHLETALAMPVPWWIMIIGTTVAFRILITAPFAILQQRVVARSLRLVPVISALAASLRVRTMREMRAAPVDAIEKKWQEEFSVRCRELRQKHRCLLRHTILPPLTQVPLFALLSLTWRSMAGYPVLWSATKTEAIAGFFGGGALWFTDLSVPDSTSILPFTIGAVHLLNIQLNTFLQDEKPSKLQKMLVHTMRLGAIFSVWVAHYVPAATAVYWLTSATYSLFQSTVLRLPAVRRWLGFPQTAKILPQRS